MRPKPPIRKGAALRCPRAGCPNNLKSYVTPIALNLAWCNKDGRLLKEVK